MRRLALLLAFLVLTACGPTRQERQDTLNRLVGLTEAAVISQLGVPARSHEANGVRFLAYEERHRGYAAGGYRSGALVGPAGGPPGPPLGTPYGWYQYGYVAVPPPMVERLCVTTVEIAGGLVRRVDLRGDGCGL